MQIQQISESQPNTPNTALQKKNQQQFVQEKSKQTNIPLQFLSTSSSFIKQLKDEENQQKKQKDKLQQLISTQYLNTPIQQQQLISSLFQQSDQQQVMQQNTLQQLQSRMLKKLTNKIFEPELQIHKQFEIKKIREDPLIQQQQLLKQSSSQNNSSHKFGQNNAILQQQQQIQFQKKALSSQSFTAAGQKHYFNKQQQNKHHNQAQQLLQQQNQTQQNPEVASNLNSTITQRLEKNNLKDMLKLEQQQNEFQMSQSKQILKDIITPNALNSLKISKRNVCKSQSTFNNQTLPNSKQQQNKPAFINTQYTTGYDNFQSFSSYILTKSQGTTPQNIQNNNSKINENNNNNNKNHYFFNYRPLRKSSELQIYEAAANNNINNTQPQQQQQGLQQQQQLEIQSSEGIINNSNELGGGGLDTENTVNDKITTENLQNIANYANNIQAQQSSPQFYQNQKLQLVNSFDSPLMNAETQDIIHHAKTSVSQKDNFYAQFLTKCVQQQYQQQQCGGKRGTAPQIMESDKKGINNNQQEENFIFEKNIDKIKLNMSELMIKLLQSQLFQVNGNKNQICKTECTNDLIDDTQQDTQIDDLYNYYFPLNPDIETKKAQQILKPNLKNRIKSNDRNSYHGKKTKNNQITAHQVKSTSPTQQRKNNAQQIQQNNITTELVSSKTNNQNTNTSSNNNNNISTNRSNVKNRNNNNQNSNNNICNSVSSRSNNINSLINNNSLNNYSNSVIPPNNNNNPNNPVYHNNSDNNNALNNKSDKLMMNLLASSSEKIFVHTSQNKNLQQLSDRAEVVSLAQWLEYMVNDTYQKKREQFSSLCSDLQVLYAACMGELVRQVSIQCQERGALLRQTWEGMLALLSQGFSSALNAHQETAQRLRNQIAQIHQGYLDKMEQYAPQIEALTKELEKRDQVNKKVLEEYRYLRKKDAKLEKYLKQCKREIKALQEDHGGLMQDFEKLKLSYDDDPIARQISEQRIAKRLQDQETGLKSLDLYFGRGQGKLNVIDDVIQENKLIAALVSAQDDDNDGGGKGGREKQEVQNEPDMTMQQKQMISNNNNKQQQKQNKNQQQQQISAQSTGFKNIYKDSKINNKDNNYSYQSQSSKSVTPIFNEISMREVIEIEGPDGMIFQQVNIGVQVGSDLIKMVDRKLDTSEINQNKTIFTQTMISELCDKEVQTVSLLQQKTDLAKSGGQQFRNSLPNNNNKRMSMMDSLVMARDGRQQPRKDSFLFALAITEQLQSLQQQQTTQQQLQSSSNQQQQQQQQQLLSQHKHSGSLANIQACHSINEEEEDKDEDGSNSQRQSTINNIDNAQINSNNNSQKNNNQMTKNNGNSQLQQQFNQQLYGGQQPQLQQQRSSMKIFSRENSSQSINLLEISKNNNNSNLLQKVQNLDTIDKSVKNQMEEDIKEVQAMSLLQINLATQLIEQIMEFDLLKENDLITNDSLYSFLNSQETFIQQYDEGIKKVLEISKGHQVDLVRQKILLTEKQTELIHLQQTHAFVSVLNQRLTEQNKKLKLSNNNSALGCESPQPLLSKGELTPSSSSNSSDQNSFDQNNNIQQEEEMKGKKEKKPEKKQQADKQSKNKKKSSSDLSQQSSFSINSRKNSGKPIGKYKSNNRDINNQFESPVHKQKNNPQQEKDQEESSLANRRLKRLNSIATPTRRRNLIIPQPGGTQPLNNNDTANNGPASNKKRHTQLFQNLISQENNKPQQQQILTNQQQQTKPQFSSQGNNNNFIATAVADPKQRYKKVKKNAKNKDNEQEQQSKIARKNLYLNINNKQKKILIPNTNPNLEAANQLLYKLRKKLDKKSINELQTTLKQANVLKIIQQIYQDKVKQKQGNSAYSSPLNVVTYDYFLNQLGFKKLAEQKITQFVVTCLGYNYNFRIRMFTKFYGVDPIMNYDLDDFNFYIDMLITCEEGSPQHIIENNQLPLQRVLDVYAREFDNKIPPNKFNQLKSEIESDRLPDQIIKNKYVIESDVALDLLLRARVEEKKSSISRLKNVYLAGDIDGNQVIGFSEYILLYRHMEAAQFNYINAITLFFQHCDMVDEFSQEQSMSFTKFAVSSVECNLFSRECQERYAQMTDHWDPIKKIDQLEKMWVKRKDIIRLRFVKTNKYNNQFRQMILRIDNYLKLAVKERKECENYIWLVYRLLDDESKRVMIEAFQEEVIPNEFNAIELAFKDLLYRGLAMQ